MSIIDLQLLKDKLPELFESKAAPDSLNNDLVCIPIDDPEWIGRKGDEDNELDTSVSLNDNLSFMDLEQIESNEEFNIEEPPFLPPGVLDFFGGNYAGAPAQYSDKSRPPNPDCFAFYLPFHYFYPDWWGVYISYDGMVWFAKLLVHLSNKCLSLSQAIKASRLFLYYHEAFHHKTECFAMRLELTHRKPLYRKGFEVEYQATLKNGTCLEEGLANATALINCKNKLKNHIIDRALIEFVKNSPPGYANGVKIKRKFTSCRCDFAEKNQNRCLPNIPQQAHEIWKAAPYMFNGIANITSRVNYIIPANSSILKRFPFRPLISPKELVKKLGLVFLKHGGNHDIFRAPNGKKIPIPRHAHDLGAGLIRKILKEAGLDMGLELFQRERRPVPVA